MPAKVIARPDVKPATPEQLLNKIAAIAADPPSSSTPDTTETVLSNFSSSSEVSTPPSQALLPPGSRVMSFQSTTGPTPGSIQPTGRRFLILAVFCYYSAINAFQWIQYTAVGNYLVPFYNVSGGITFEEINYTSTAYMVVYLPLAFPAIFFIERQGVKGSMIAGSVLMFVGSCLKLFSGYERTYNSFYWLLTGQAISAAAQLFVLSLPPLIAACWFPDDNVSSTTGIGVFGNQVGIALGFLIPPLIVSDIRIEEYQLVGWRLKALEGFVAGSCFILIALSVFLVQSKPKYPPGLAQWALRESERQRNLTENQNIVTSDATRQSRVSRSLRRVHYFNRVASSSLQAAQDQNLQVESSLGQPGAEVEAQETVRLSSGSPSENSNDSDVGQIFYIRWYNYLCNSQCASLIKNRNFMLLAISYGVMVGVFYAYATLLNAMIDARRKGNNSLTGYLGFETVISGMLGSVMCAYLLDRFRNYKFTVIGVHSASILSMLLFASVLESTQMNEPLHLSALALGFFMTGYLPIGFEFAAEITYPISEGTSATLLNSMAQIFGIILTNRATHFLKTKGTEWCSFVLYLSLALGLIPILFVKEELRRQAAATTASHSPDNSTSSQPSSPSNNPDPSTSCTGTTIRPADSSTRPSLTPRPSEPSVSYQAQTESARIQSNPTNPN